MLLSLPELLPRKERRKLRPRLIAKRPRISLLIQKLKPRQTVMLRMPLLQLQKLPQQPKIRLKKMLRKPRRLLKPRLLLMLLRPKLI
jgi:hypothetical protein